MGSDTSEHEPKGKGKEAVRPSPSDEHSKDLSSTGHDGQDALTLASRILRSATSVSKSIVTGPPSASGLAALAGQEKGQSSGAAESLERAGESSVQFSSSAAASESFHPSHTREHIAGEETAFAEFLDSTPTFVPAQIDQMERAWQTNTLSGGPYALGTGLDAGRGAHSSVAEQEGRDGNEVAALLSAPDEAPLELPDDNMMTPEDQASLRRALFGGDGASERPFSSDWDDLLNFIPGYLRTPDGGRFGEFDASATAMAQESLAHMGISDPTEASKTWVGQWSDVLSRYQDEVWGDLGSLVQEAREEVQRLEHPQGESPPPEPKALLRLRAILGHLRGG
ncbi:hypothetical protein GQ53DRAFT_217706 [Thozetella sp. PMI_491]|nr:hypothetical protein GQ53DRAFT_217706 [Thozetella sp. PMI_491]